MTSRRVPGGDATIAVWQVHVSQCESEHLLDFLSVMPMQQLQSCVVAPCPANPRWHDMARNWPHTLIINMTLQSPRCLTNAQAWEPPTRAAVYTESLARVSRPRSKLHVLPLPRHGHGDSSMCVARFGPMSVRTHQHAKWSLTCKCISQA